MLEGNCHRPQNEKPGPRDPGFSRPGLEPKVGFEPTTARLRIECSTAELLRQVGSARRRTLRYFSERTPRRQVTPRTSQAWAGIDPLPAAEPEDFLGVGMVRFSLR